MNRCKTFVASLAITVVAGCLPQPNDSAPEVPFPTLLKRAMDAKPTSIDSTVVLEEVLRPQTKKLEFRYSLTPAGKIAATNSSGETLRKIAVGVTQKDPLAVSASKNGIAIEHIFNDASGGLVLSLIVADGADAAMPVRAEPAKSKTNVTGVQSNPFLQ